MIKTPPRGGRCSQRGRQYHLLNVTATYCWFNQQLVRANDITSDFNSVIITGHKITFCNVMLPRAIFPRAFTVIVSYTEIAICLCVHVP